MFYRIIPLQDRRQVRLRGEAAPLQLPGRHRHRGQGLLFEGESLISDDGEAVRANRKSNAFFNWLLQSCASSCLSRTIRR